MNQKDPIIKNKIIDAYAKNCILTEKKTYKDISLLKPYLPNQIMPTARQLKKWRIYGLAMNKIKNGDLDINDELGLWTPSFCSGIRDSGIFYKTKNNLFMLPFKPNQSFLLDIKESKLPYKLSKVYQNNHINLSRCLFLKLGVKDGLYNYNEYLGGLFTGCRIISVEGEECMVINPKNEATLKKVITVLGNYKIAYKMGNNGQILISPYYGALFFGYMPIHSSTRLINIKRAYQGSKLALVYWHMVRDVGQPVAPLKAQILPYALSYASYWNKGILKNTDIRELGVDMGIFGISDELRELMKEWIRYHS